MSAVKTTCWYAYVQVTWPDYKTTAPLLSKRTSQLVACRRLSSGLEKHRITIRRARICLYDGVSFVGNAQTLEAVQEDPAKPWNWTFRADKADSHYKVRNTCLVDRHDCTCARLSER